MPTDLVDFEGLSPPDRPGGDDPKYKWSKEKLDNEYKKARKCGNKKLAQQIKKIQKHKGFRKSGKAIAKKIGKKILKKGLGKVFPVIGACWFAYDCYKGGVKHALKEHLVPW